MNRISLHTEKRIIELWFKGVTRDTIADELGVSGSTVSSITSKLPEEARELRSLSVELSKHNLSIPEAKKGAKLLSRLNQLGVSYTQLRDGINAVEKTSKKEGYEPRLVVQATMKLSKLEKEAGKSYTQVLQTFKAKTRQIKKLEKRGQNLKERTLEKKREQQQQLTQNRVTKREINYVQNLRQNLGKYGIRLSDVESLQKYLRNMKETGGTPKRFTEYTKKQGSLKRRLTNLEKKEQQKILRLESLDGKVQRCKDEIGSHLDRISSLEEEESQKWKTLQNMDQKISEAQETYQEELKGLATLLKVKPRVEEINNAIKTNVEKLDNLNNSIAQKQNSLQTTQEKILELEGQKQTLEFEVSKRLGIRNFTTQLQTSILNLQHQKALLERENEEKKERLALADTITDFLTRQPVYDFNRFYTNIETIKRAREGQFPLLTPLLPAMEEEVRMLALKAFEGDIVSKAQFKSIYDERKVLKAEVEELKGQLKEANKKLECAQNENKLLQTIRVDFAGRPTTLQDLRNWVASTFSEEIEKRASEKYNLVAAGTAGVLHFIYRKITEKQ